MNRRDFARLAGTALSAGAFSESLVEAQVAARPAAPRAATRARMKVGTQHGDSDEILKVLAGFGVNHICSRLPAPAMGAAWSVDSLSRLRERVESFGITLDMVPLPMSSSEISRSESPAIMLGTEPDRQKQIDGICEMIRNSSRAGIPSLKYNLTFIGVPRTAPTPGRGGARYSTFVYADAKQDPPLTAAGRVDADVYWERITYFLERVVPVAAEHKVRLACHPQDPGMPKGKGWRGVETVLGSFDGLKRFVSIAESPYHGLNFCQGTVSEMLEQPGRADLRRHPLLRLAQEDLQRPLPQHRRRLPQLPRDVHRRWRRGHVEGDAGLQGSRIRRHDDAGPRSRRSTATPAACRRSPSRSATSRR